MFRAILEILVMIIVVAMARSILTGIVRGISGASAKAGRSSASGTRTTASESATGTLRKDPVCGTFVAESTAFKRQVGSQSFLYCSQACKAAHQMQSK